MLALLVLSFLLFDYLNVYATSTADDPTGQRILQERKERRRAKRRERIRQDRESWTPGEKEARLERNRVYQREHRAKERRVMMSAIVRDEAGTSIDCAALQKLKKYRERNREDVVKKEVKALQLTDEGEREAAARRIRAELGHVKLLEPYVPHLRQSKDSVSITSIQANEGLDSSATCTEPDLNLSL
jgi:hypothetical protein